jgi:hypothetical protein
MNLVTRSHIADNLTTRRKRMLFACGCVRQVWHLVPDSRSKTAVEVLERFVDGRASQNEIEAANDEAHLPKWKAAEEGAFGSLDPAVRAAAWATAAVSQASRIGSSASSMPGTEAGMVVDVATKAIRAWAWSGKERGEIRRWQQAVLADLIDPNRPHSFAIDPSCFTSTVIALAEKIYQERAFDRMPILADALQDAGCENEDVLNHCRSEGPHVRGCWVIDLLTVRK